MTTSPAPGADEDQPRALRPRVALRHKSSNDPSTFILQCLLLNQQAHYILARYSFPHNCVTSRQKMCEFEIHFNNLMMVNFFNDLNIEIVFCFFFSPSYVGSQNTNVCPDTLTKARLIVRISKHTCVVF